MARRIWLSSAGQAYEICRFGANGGTRVARKNFAEGDNRLAQRRDGAGELRSELAQKRCDAGLHLRRLRSGPGQLLGIRDERQREAAVVTT